MPALVTPARFGQSRDDVEQFHLGPRAQRPIEPLIGGRLLAALRAGRLSRKSAVIDLDPVETAHRLLQFEPPEPGAPLDHPGGEEDGERRADGAPGSARRNRARRDSRRRRSARRKAARRRSQPGDRFLEGHDLETLRPEKP